MAQLFKISLENNQGELLTMLLLLASKVTQIECSRVLYFLTGLVAHIDLPATLVSMHSFSHAYQVTIFGVLHSRIGTEIQEKGEKYDQVPITKFDLPQANRAINIAKI